MYQRMNQSITEKGLFNTFLFLTKSKLDLQTPFVNHMRS